ncbi:hypothetical protein MRB53_021008 [Persea americana]|uniref:Uncharacterized protein n=1 Tax=Persea americana TaxID=3435 RepID=A0ACC2L2D4_PERAE|nr:hypothetical protein MRB53_021008 [Persea americana]
MHVAVDLDYSSQKMFHPLRPNLGLGVCLGAAERATPFITDDLWYGIFAADASTNSTYKFFRNFSDAFTPLWVLSSFSETFQSRNPISPSPNPIVSNFSKSFLNNTNKKMKKKKKKKILIQARHSSNLSPKPTFPAFSHPPFSRLDSDLYTIRSIRHTLELFVKSLRKLR